MQALLILSLALGMTSGTPDGRTAPRDFEALAGEARLRSFQVLADLEPEQTEALASLAERVGAACDRYLNRRKSLLQIQQTTFKDLWEQDLDGGEFALLTPRVSSRANGLGLEESKEFVRSLTMFDELGREVLDPGQQLLIDSFEPMEFVRCALGEKQRAPGDPLQRQAWGALEAVAGAKGGALSRKAATEAKKLVRMAEREDLPAWNSEAELVRITAFLERAAHLSNSASERCRTRLAHELLPNTKTDHTWEGLHRIHLEEHPESSTLVRLLMTENAAAILRGGVASDPSSQRREVRELEAQVETLRCQISLINLLNGLHLSREQLNKLAEIADRVAEELPSTVDAVPSTFSSLGFPPSLPGLTPEQGDLRQLQLEMGRLRADADRGRLPSAKKVRLVETISGYYPESKRPVTSEQRSACAAKVLEVLTPAQESVVLRFQACLIPPPELRNPVRVGQAGGDEALLGALKRARYLDPDEYQARKEKLVERVLSHIERQEGSWPAEEREQALGQVATIFDEARALDDVAFAVHSPGFAGRLEDLGRKKRLLEELELDSSQQLEKRALRFFLDPDFSTLAREIVARRDRRGAPDPVDLEKITGAPTCDDGGCAVD